jgi:hypothetical protein
MRTIIQKVIKGETFVTKTEIVKDDKFDINYSVHDRKTGGPYERLLQKFNDETERKILESFKTYCQEVDNTFSDIGADVRRCMTLQSSKDGPGHAEARKQQNLRPWKEMHGKLKMKLTELQKGLEHIQDFEQDLVEEFSEDEESLFVSEQTHGRKRSASVLD